MFTGTVNITKFPVMKVFFKACVWIEVIELEVHMLSISVCKMDAQNCIKHSNTILLKGRVEYSGKMVCVTFRECTIQKSKRLSLDFPPKPRRQSIGMQRRGNGKKAVEFDKNLTSQ